MWVPGGCLTPPSLFLGPSNHFGTPFPNDQGSVGWGACVTSHGLILSWDGQSGRVRPPSDLLRLSFRELDTAYRLLRRPGRFRAKMLPPVSKFLARNLKLASIHSFQVLACGPRAIEAKWLLGSAREIRSSSELPGSLIS